MARERGAIDERDGSRSSTAVILEWWNWRLAVKLGAVLIVPVLAVVALGTWLVGSEINRAESFVRADSLVSAKVAEQGLLNDLQDERTMSAQLLGATGPANPETLSRQWQKVDNARRATQRAVELTHDPVVAARYRDVEERLAALSQLRQSVRNGTTDAVRTQSQYTDATTALLRFDQGLVSQIGDPVLSGTATSLHNLALADEQVTVQHAVIAAGIGRDRVLPDDVRVLQASRARWEARMADFRAVATPEQLQSYNSTVTGPDVPARQGLFQEAFDQATKPAPKSPVLQIDGAEWNRLSANVTGMSRAVHTSGLNQLRAVSANLQDSSSNLAGTEAVILVSVLSVAALVVLAVGRNLVTSLGTLRRTALDVANRKLPAAVAGIHEGRPADRTIEPVPVHSGGEIGQLARAVDTLHSEAVRLAAEQAELRDNLNTTFVSVSRRSQSMVEHLLRELEQLERNEEDPDQLSSLFTLDHLATRMRRNNENLVVLSGGDLSRRFSQPLPLADVLRAAVSEIDQYERVVVRPSPGVRVAGYAAGDLVRLLAELLDNAGEYSPPETRVTVTSRHDEGRGLVVEIADEGIGMGDTDLADANRRLSESGGVSDAVARQMGLFVVGRLAQKHGITVKLARNGDGPGLLAVVVTPENVLVPGRGQVKEAMLPAGSKRVETAAMPSQRRPSPGPRHQRGGPGEQRIALHRSGEILPPAAAGTNGTPQDEVPPAAWPQPEHTADADTPRDSGGAPTDTPIPDLPPAESSAVGLFTPVRPATEPDLDTWGGFPAYSPEPGESGHSGLPQATPAASGWFDDAPPLTDSSSGEIPEWPQEPDPGGFGDEGWPGQAQDPRPPNWWTTPTQEGWQAADEVAEAAPAAHTQAGLPRRTPREHLLPGSASPSRHAQPAPPKRDATDLRHRITSFQAASGRHSESSHQAGPGRSGPEGGAR